MSSEDTFPELVGFDEEPVAEGVPTTSAEVLNV